ncbi:MAG: hypothetical protein ROO76_10245 [Terriglobia bacterium]|nr:hypothetical protein [Terriglobia bacterium]
MKTRISGYLASASGVAIKGGGFAALLLLAMFVSLAPAQAQAQTSSDTWKSVAIIGGSTAAGAIIGHKIGGPTGAWIGAAAGGATGYAIDRRRRQNEYNNGYYGYNAPYPQNGGYYGNDPNPNSGPYYPSNAPYYPNSGYYGGPGYSNGPAYQTTGYYGNGNRRCSHR